MKSRILSETFPEPVAHVLPKSLDDEDGSSEDDPDNYEEYMRAVLRQAVEHPDVPSSYGYKHKH